MKLFLLPNVVLFLVNFYMVSGCVTDGSETKEVNLPSAPPTSVPSPIPGPVVAPQVVETPPLNEFEAPLPAYSPGPVGRPAQRLLDKASEQWKLLHRDQALALLDRAFRIENQSTEISLRHSEYYFEMGQFLKSQNWAKRAIGNSQVTPEQRQRAWHLIARTLYRLGDQAGAQKAMSEANRQ